MSEYLTKEEVKAWRSSVEKITLEEYAARLGKKLEEEKETNDIVDIIYNGGNVVQEYNQGNVDKSIKIYQRPEPIKLERVKKAVEPETIEKIVTAPRPEIVKQVEPVRQEAVKQVKPVIQPKPVQKSVAPKAEITKKESSVDIDDLGLTFSKKLTDRETKVFEYLSKNMGKVVFAKDIADLLEMKRDYIYKYIKNLRNKIVEDVLHNSDGGGFIFKI